MKKTINVSKNEIIMGKNKQQSRLTLNQALLPYVRVVEAFSFQDGMRLHHQSLITAAVSFVAVVDDDIPTDNVCSFYLEIVLVSQSGDEYLINSSYSFGQAFANYSHPIDVRIEMHNQVPVGSYTLKFRSANILDKSEVYWIMDALGDTFAINVDVVS